MSVFPPLINKNFNLKCIFLTFPSRNTFFAGLCIRGFTRGDPPAVRLLRKYKYLHEKKGFSGCKGTRYINTPPRSKC